MSTVDTAGTHDPGLHASKIKEKEGTSKRELNFAPEKKSFWKIEIFSKYIDEKMGYLSLFDAIWINFSEEDVYIYVIPIAKPYYLKVFKRLG